MNSKLKSIWKIRFTSAKILGPQKLLRLLRNWLISSRKNDENYFSGTRNGSKSIRKIPNGLHCFTISVNSYGHSSGYFKLELEFADRSHEIDHSTVLFTHTYTVCYESLPLTLKLILNNGQISGNGANGVMFDIDGADIKGLKCVLPHLDVLLDTAMLMLMTKLTRHVQLIEIDVFTSLTVRFANFWKIDSLNILIVNRRWCGR